MILVSLARTWPLVLRGDADDGEAGALLGPWPVRPTELANLDSYADVIAGVFRGQVVAVYDITGRRAENRPSALRRRHTDWDGSSSA